MCCINAAELQYFKEYVSIFSQLLSVLRCVELWMTCWWGHGQGSCLLVKINGGHYQLHYMNPLQPPALLVQ